MQERRAIRLKATLAAALIAFGMCASANDEHLRLPEVKSVAEIPGTFNMIEDGTGRMIIVSANTRYVFKSFELIDTWHDNVQITSTTQLQSLSNKLQPSMIPLDMMLVLRLPGDGKSQPLIAYVDPEADSSKSFIRAAIEGGNPTHLVVVPFSGEPSSLKSKRLSCAVQAGNKAEAAAALINDDYEGLPPVSQCSEHAALRANVITARTIGVNGTPFVISSDGRMFRGLPPDLTAFAKAAK